MPSTYEEKALKGILTWKNPKLGWFDKALRVVSWPLEMAGELVMKTPGIGWVIEKSVSGLVSLANDAAQWSVRPEAIFAEYRKAGHGHVTGHDDLLNLDLEHVDRAIGLLAAKYKGVALGEGAAAGAVGLFGMPVDIVAMVAWNLRAIGEYATYCGFDVTSQHERLFAMNVLGLASSPDDRSKAIAMAQLVRIARDVAKKKAWVDLE